MGDRTSVNIGLYRWHARAVGALFWVPTTVLYFIDQVGLARALQVQALYYASVVLCEVPSGWFSDRVGRVATLRITAAAWVGAFGCFLVGGLGPIVAGQVLLAIGYASLSGTDVTFLFDTLDAAGRSETFEDEEASAREGSLYLAAVTALAGGALGLLDLRLPYVAALVVALVQFGITMRMNEPARRTIAASVGWRRDASAIGRHLRTRVLGWIAFYTAAEVVLIHLASELAAPFAAGVLERPSDDPAGAAAIAGALVAGAALIGAVTLRGFGAARRRVGTVGVLIGAGFVSAGLVGLMAVVAAIWVLPLLTLRGVQASVTNVAVPAIVGRRVEAQHRATTLSVMSLLGRGTYAGVLVLLAATVGDVFDSVLNTAAVLAVATASAVALAALTLRPDVDAVVVDPG